MVFHAGYEPVSSKLKVSLALNPLDCPNEKYHGDSSSLSQSNVKLICNENAVLVGFAIYCSFVMLPLATDRF